MANVKINAPVPFGLPAAGVLTGTEQVPFDQTTGGNIKTVRGSVASFLGSISVTYPTGTVTINAGTIIASGAGLIVSGPAATQDNFLTLGQAGQYTWQLYGTASSNDMHWYNNNFGDVMVFTGTGRVGVGTVPDSNFQVIQGGGAGTAGMRIGYNSTSQNYYDADTHFIRSGNQGTTFAKIVPNQIQVISNAGGYAATFGSLAGLTINNTAGTSQSAIDFGVNSIICGRLRSDYAGNLTYVATASGEHIFFTGGDSGVGTVIAQLASTGIVVGSPTGGFKGAGTINCTGLYVNGVAVTVP